MEWRSARPSDQPILDHLIKPISEQLMNYYEGNKDQEFNFTLSNSQWAEMDANGAEWLKQTSILGESAPSIAKRMGLMNFKICMILSLLRHFEKQNVGKQINCEPEDFRTAVALCQVYFKSSMFVYKKLSKSGADVLKPNVRQLYEQLPESFDHNMRDDVALKLGFDVKTGRNHCKELIKNGYIESTDKAKVWRKVHY
jgi:hypothetical protein